MAVSPTRTETPRARLAVALELLGECYGIRLPDPDDDASVVTFLAEAVAALALDRKTLRATRQSKRTLR